MLEDPCDHISLPPEGGGDVKVFVTPLMVSSYLGDYTAVDVIIRNSGEKWREAVLAKSLPGGDDSLALAKEALEIAQLLYDGSKVLQAEANTQEERDAQDQIFAEYATGLEMTEKLVGRLASMKQLALEKKKNDKIRSLLKVFVGLVFVFIACILFYYCLGFIWRHLRFCIKCFVYLGMFMAFTISPVTVGGLLLAYYIYTIGRNEASQPSHAPKAGINGPPPSNPGDSTDFFCLDGESCFKGDVCTDNILKHSCECGDDLKYLCTKHVSADWKRKKSFEHINSDSTATESITVGVCLFMISGWLLYAFQGSPQHSSKKKRKKKKKRGENKK